MSLENRHRHARFPPHYDDLKLAFERACSEEDAAVGASTLDAIFQLDHLRGIVPPLSLYLPMAETLLAFARPIEKVRILLRRSDFPSSETGQSKTAAARDAIGLLTGSGERRRGFVAYLNLGMAAAMEQRIGDAELVLTQAHSIEDPHWPSRQHWLAARAGSRVQAHCGDRAAYRAALTTEIP
jgi:hypothetical protein